MISSVIEAVATATAIGEIRKLPVSDQKVRRVPHNGRQDPYCTVLDTKRRVQWGLWSRLIRASEFAKQVALRLMIGVFSFATPCKDKAIEIGFGEN